MVSLRALCSDMTPQRQHKGAEQRPRAGARQGERRGGGRREAERESDVRARDRDRTLRERESKRDKRDEEKIEKEMSVGTDWM